MQVLWRLSSGETRLTHEIASRKHSRRCY